MELVPASFAQVVTGREGRKITLDPGSDVLDVVRQVKQISASLSVHWNDAGEYFEIREQNGIKSELVLTALELDQRVVQRLLLIASEDYNFSKDIQRIDNEAEKQIEDRFTEQIGERGEPLAHALRKDLQVQGHIYVPGGWNGSR